MQGNQLIIFIFFLAFHGLSFGSGQPFDITKAPDQKTWSYFFNLPKNARHALWKEQQEVHGSTLRSWAWQWRLAWVRACSSSREPYCHKITAEALFDKAMVVRAESARGLGVRFEGTGSEPILKLLAQAYQNPGNRRNGKPLFVQNRILSAMNKIGGPLGHQWGQRLAARSPQTQRYWDKLTRLAASKP